MREVIFWIFVIILMAVVLILGYFTSIYYTDVQKKNCSIYKTEYQVTHSGCLRLLEEKK